jgi:hypothetical protein
MTKASTIRQLLQEPTVPNMRWIAILAASVIGNERTGRDISEGEHVGSIYGEMCLLHGRYNVVGGLATSRSGKHTVIRVIEYGRSITDVSKEKQQIETTHRNPQYHPWDFACSPKAQTSNPSCFHGMRSDAPVNSSVSTSHQHPSGSLRCTSCSGPKHTDVRINADSGQATGVQLDGRRSSLVGPTDVCLYCRASYQSFSTVGQETCRSGQSPSSVSSTKEHPFRELLQNLTVSCSPAQV